MTRKHTTIGILLLLISIYIRTDNLIIVLLILTWTSTIQKTVTAPYAIVLAAIAAGSVYFINHFSGNYGWAVLFRFSFLPGSTVPNQIPSYVSIKEYIHVLAPACVEIVTRFAPWAILGVAAWMRTCMGSRWLLSIVAVAVASHFFLFPSPQDRYYAWGYLVVAAIFIESLDCDRRILASTQQKYAGVP